jgi:hypothetical protein
LADYFEPGDGTGARLAVDFLRAFQGIELRIPER